MFKLVSAGIGFFLLSAFPAGKLTVRLEADDMLRFNLQQFEARQGDELTLVLVNTGKIPSLRHNFVLLKPGTNTALFGNAAMNAESSEFIPPNMESSVIARTRLAGPGQEQKVTFVVPAKGSYEYICSAPGHYSISKGRLLVN